jgi:hypothetical protein
MKYWVISEAIDESFISGSRWIAFPATEETLEKVKEIAGLFDSRVYVAIEQTAARRNRDKGSIAELAIPEAAVKEES